MTCGLVGLVHNLRSGGRNAGLVGEMQVWWERGQLAISYLT